MLRLSLSGAAADRHFSEELTPLRDQANNTNLCRQLGLRYVGAAWPFLRSQPRSVEYQMNEARVACTKAALCMLEFPETIVAGRGRRQQERHQKAHGLIQSEAEGS